MTLTLYGIANCDTVKKARTWLADHGHAVAFHDYKKAGVEAEALARWVDAIGWETVLNRQGTTFRKLPEADRVDLARDKAIALMVANPSMIRRPIMEGDGVLLAGFKPDQWQAQLG